MVDDSSGKNELRRVVDVVLVRIEGPAGRLLIETHLQHSDGRKDQSGASYVT